MASGIRGLTGLWPQVLTAASRIPLGALNSGSVVLGERSPYEPDLQHHPSTPKRQLRRAKKNHPRPGLGADSSRSCASPLGVFNPGKPRRPFGRWQFRVGVSGFRSLAEIQACQGGEAVEGLRVYGGSARFTELQEGFGTFRAPGPRCFKVQVLDRMLGLKRV